MNNLPAYTCICCGKVHFEWPALTFDSPDNYNCLSDSDKINIAELGTDFCIIKHDDQIDRFIRCTMTQKVNDYCENLEYGLWVSLSEKSFNDYSENYKNEHKGEIKYFGWLSNELVEYEYQGSIPTTVFPRNEKHRPEIIPHIDFDHPLVKDYYNGISKQEAEIRISNILKKIGERNNLLFS